MLLKRIKKRKRKNHWKQMGAKWGGGGGYETEARKEPLLAWSPCVPVVWTQGYWPRSHLQSCIEKVAQVIGWQETESKPIGSVRDIWYKSRQGLCESQPWEAQPELQEHCLSLFSLLIRLVLALLCELASLSQTVSLITYLLPCDHVPSGAASAFHFCPVCWQSQVCTWLGSRSTWSCHQSAVHLSTYRCPNSYTQPVSCKLNYKCFYICLKFVLGWGWGGMCHSTSIEVREQLVNARVSSLLWPESPGWNSGL